MGGRPYSPRTRLVPRAPPPASEHAPAPRAAPEPGPEGLVFVLDGRPTPDGTTVRARVRGDALGSAGIRDGDEVLLARRARAEHGDLAAYDGDAGCASPTLWRVRDGGDEVRGVNDAQSVVLGANARLLGVVLAVRRRFSEPAR